MAKPSPKEAKEAKEEGRQSESFRALKRVGEEGKASVADLAIRPAKDEDMEAVAAIYAHHVLYGNGSFETEPLAAEEMKRRRAAVVERGLPYLVAEAEGAILGYAYATPYRTRAAYRNTVENSVYVRADLARRGIGRRLLETLIRECEKEGFRQMVAVVGDSANLASIRLHLALGFRLVGTLSAVGRKHGLWLDTVLLQRVLGPGEKTAPADES